MEALTDLSRQVIARATAARFKLVTAESCTGGALATLLTDTPGAGDVLFGGFVCYDKDFKRTILGVPAALLAKETAVSEDVAVAMARGALDLTGCDLSIAITGVTGPKPDEDGNPVGLVHIAVALKDGKLDHQKCDFARDSAGRICGEAMRHALQMTLARLPPCS